MSFFLLNRLNLISKPINKILKKNPNHASIHTSSFLRYSAKEKAARDAIKKYTKKSQLKPIVIRPNMTIKELADAMNKPTKQVFDCLNQINYVRNHRDSAVISNIGVIMKIVKLSGFRYQLPGSQEFDFDEVEAELNEKDDDRSKRPRPNRKDLIRRPPVVTIMGHVDHGKTTLLDSLRGTNVVEKEFGGITQHIGAFNVRLLNTTADKITTQERNITFLDTPGHAAFSMMRSRGAKVTDIVVLVIAAEDGVMAQTVESIEHAKSTGCPIIVAINKIDKCNEAQIKRVKNELLKYELIPEEMGGDVQIVPISALKKTNLEILKEEIWTRAEIMELKGDPKGLVEGYVIESTQDLHKGKLATVLVQRGTLTKGSYLVAGRTWCKVKFLFDENSSNLNKVTLSQAVQVMGWKDLPDAGDEVIEVESEHRAKELVDIRHRKETLLKQKHDLGIIKLKRQEHSEFYRIKLNEKRLSGSKRPVTISEPVEIANPSTHENTLDKSGTSLPNIDESIKKLHIIIKADVNGSLEAILNVLETYNCHDKVVLDLVHFEVGPIKKSDLEVAEMFGAIIYCFNLPVNNTLESSNESSENTQKKYKIKHFNVIYKLFDDLKSEINELTPLVELEEKVGEADILKVFDYNETNKKTIKVAGGKCTEGLIDRKLVFRLIRNNEILVDKQQCRSLKHLKNDVNTIQRNVEFGFSFEDMSIDPKPGDKLVCLNVKMVKSVIDWNLGF